MWKDVEGAAPIISITNGVHAPTWQDARIRAALVPDKPRERQDAELWDAHQAMKRELLAEIAAPHRRPALARRPARSGSRAARRRTSAPT